MKTTADDFTALSQQNSSVSFKLNYVGDCFLRDGSGIVEGTIYFTFSLYKCTMVLCMSLYPSESKFSMHALLESERTRQGGKRQKRCCQLLCCKAPRYSCDESGVRKHKA